MKTTKIEMILVHLIQNKAIDPKVAGAKYDCWGLPAIIFDLRRSGIDIETRNKKGEPCSYHLISYSQAKNLARNYKYQRIERYKKQAR